MRSGCPILLILLLLVGCTTSKNSSVSDASEKNTLLIDLSIEPRAFDPALVTDIPGIELLNNIFEGLTRIGVDNKVEPALAEKWEISSDGKTYTFTLRKGVNFHDIAPYFALRS